MTSIVLSLDPIRIRSDPDNPMVAKCPSCWENLVIHQPDEESPDRLLATCLD